MRLVAYFGSQRAPSISDVDTMYASLYLRRQVTLPTLSLVAVIIIAYLTLCLVIFPPHMSSHRCFREEHFSGSNSKFMVRHKVIFGTPNYSRISNYLDLSVIRIEHYSQRSQSMYKLNCSYGR